MRVRNDRRGAAGIMLVQGLIYVAVLAVICYSAFELFFSLSAGARRVRAAGEDIVRTMNVGERWRSDVRGAEVLALEEDGRGLRLGDVSYEFAEGEIRRSVDGRTVTVLPNVAQSRFVRDERESVLAWRWEVELVNSNPRSNLKPLFTFLAVSGKETGE